MRRVSLLRREDIVSSMGEGGISLGVDERENIAEDRLCRVSFMAGGGGGDITYLAIRSLAFSFRMGERTVRKIVYSTCEAIIELLQPIVMPKPSEDTWIESEKGVSDLAKTDFRSADYRLFNMADHHLTKKDRLANPSGLN
ncbi:hypothetical protein MSG28_013601 [Choristoneura fumiferana]|uniref:Uncharacterized protein n=1 Tax=Choristoneura fumiferana TaxID=7141 RepID=A0ACC0K892_CHOFU|nr:hypothetical protein MSG28_013601 [Choristoneura fumiferana]